MVDETPKTHNDPEQGRKKKRKEPPSSGLARIAVGSGETQALTSFNLRNSQESILSGWIRDSEQPESDSLFTRVAAFRHRRWRGSFAFRFRLPPQPKYAIH